MVRSLGVIRNRNEAFLSMDIKCLFVQDVPELCLDI